MLKMVGQVNDTLKCFPSTKMVILFYHSAEHFPLGSQALLRMCLSEWPHPEEKNISNAQGQALQQVQEVVF